MPAITVLVASADRASRKACQDLLAGQLGVRAVGEARTGLQALALLGMLKPRVVLLDFSMWRGAAGRSLISAIRQRHPGARVLVLAKPVSEARMLDALAQGARGYLTWDALPAFLVRAVKAVHAGEAWVPRRMVALLLDRLAALSAAAPGSYLSVQKGLRG